MSKPTNNYAAVIYAADTDLVVEERPIPVPGPGDVLINNKFVAINPIDWKRQAWGNDIPFYPQILGHDISGVVVSVGDGVDEFKPGDRVFANVHQLVTHNLDHGAFQGYAVARTTATGPLPARTSLEQGATLGVATYTAAGGLVGVLGLPRAWLERNVAAGAAPAPDAPSMVIWGGTSQVGVLAIQLARLAGLRVLAAASPRHHDYLRSLGAAALVDYRASSAIDDLLAAADEAGAPVAYVLDAISYPDTLKSCLEILRRSGAKKFAYSLNWPEDLPGPDADIESGFIQGADIYNTGKDLGAWLYHEALPRWLEQGLITPPRYRIIGEGMGAVQTALNEVKKGVSGEKILVAV